MFNYKNFNAGDLVLCLGEFCLRDIKTGEEVKDFQDIRGMGITLPEADAYYVIRSTMNFFSGSYVLLEEIHNPNSDAGPELAFPAYLFEKVDTMTDESKYWEHDKK